MKAKQDHIIVYTHLFGIPKLNIDQFQIYAMRIHGRYEALKTNNGCDLKVKKLVLMHQSKFGIFD